MSFQRTGRLGLMVALAATLPVLHAAGATSPDSRMFLLKGVTFVGNKRVSTDTLDGVVGIHPGEHVNRDSIVNAFNNVIAEYKKDNVGAQIQPEMRTEGSSMTVVFKIAEQAAPAPVVTNAVLAHETFTGNQKISSDKLQAALTMKLGAPVTSEMVVTDRDALRNIYKAAGLGATITPKVTEIPGGKVDLNFEIVEGLKAKEKRKPVDTQDPTE